MSGAETPPPSPTLRSLLQGLEGVDADALDVTIHPGDAMYGFAFDLMGGVREQARVEYFRSGHHAWRVVDAALRRVLGPRFPARRPARLLDFGSGHGRVTRFLVPHLGKDRLTSTEADESAVEFLRQHFDLAAYRTPANPELDDFDLRREFQTPEGFDALIALSVLTHLPERTFTAWLRRWLDALMVEGGVLLFTTLGPSTLLEGRSMPSSGFHFERVSESRVLDLDEYGTAWVTADWVGRTLDRLTDGLARWQHVPLGIWNLQDLWLVTLDPSLDWGDDVELLVDQPTGHLEVCHLADDRRFLRVSGWATGGRWPAREARVELVLGGETVADVRPHKTRPDAAAMLGHPQLGEDLLLDFSLGYQSPEPLDPSSQMRIEVVDDVGPRSNGRRHVLHAGSIEATELYLPLRHFRSLSDHYGNLVQIFESSRWGKMRRAWMSWKGRLG